MFVLGITGGIGAGKSLVLSIIDEEFDAYIVEADKLAHKLMLKGEDAYSQIIDTFGDEILDPDSEQIDRSILGKLVLSDKEKLSRLNAIMHPAVKKYIIDDIKLKEDAGTKLYVIEAALLIQDGYKSICDEIWYISSDREVRIQRLIESRGYSREKAEAFLLNQPSDEFFEINSDKIIKNNENQMKLRAEVVSLINNNLLKK
ncbi:MAG: dephospho-CoA kinase [Eubacterium sp.]|nr:dephospho-CoA kinase [Eubacterium sp.]